MLGSRWIVRKLTRSVSKSKKGSWRCLSSNFVEVDPDALLDPGMETFSPGWQAQGHRVSLFLFFFVIVGWFDPEVNQGKGLADKAFLQPDRK